MDVLPCTTLIYKVVLLYTNLATPTLLSTRISAHYSHRHPCDPVSQLTRPFTLLDLRTQYLNGRLSHRLSTDDGYLPRHPCDSPHEVTPGACLTSAEPSGDVRSITRHSHTPRAFTLHSFYILLSIDAPSFYCGKSRGCSGGRRGCAGEGGLRVWPA